HVRMLRLQFSQEYGSAEHEHATVPQELAAGEIFFRKLLAGLLPERGDGARVLPDIGTALYIAEPGFRAGGGDAKCHQTTLLRELGGSSDRIAEHRIVTDRVIGGQH